MPVDGGRGLVLVATERQCGYGVSGWSAERGDNCAGTPEVGFRDGAGEAVMSRNGVTGQLTLC
jgi:hypothetical protein